MGILFDAERRLRCATYAAYDAATTSHDPAKRASHIASARALIAQLPQSRAERLLLKEA